MDCRNTSGAASGFMQPGAATSPDPSHAFCDSDFCVQKTIQWTVLSCRIRFQTMLSCRTRIQTWLSVSASVHSTAFADHAPLPTQKHVARIETVCRICADLTDQ